MEKSSSTSVLPVFNVEISFHLLSFSRRKKFNFALQQKKITIFEIYNIVLYEENLWFEIHMAE